MLSSTESIMSSFNHGRPYFWRESLTSFTKSLDQGRQHLVAFVSSLVVVHSVAHCEILFRKETRCLTLKNLPLKPTMM
jgi:hypothetical protein